jgi:hypothetical protein
MNKLIKTFAAILIFLCFPIAHADSDPNSIFPLAHYDQTISTWIKPADPQFDKLALTQAVQEKHLDLFYEHYIGSLSPWSDIFVNRVLQSPAPNNLKTIEQTIINNFNNEGKSEEQLGYDENYQLYTHEWLEEIVNNINISQFDNLTYEINNRGITIDNLTVRILPTEDVYFHHKKFAGQGYPFDLLQMSAVWAGTPLYILGETRNHVWMLVLTADYIGWVKSVGVARTDSSFIANWTVAATNELAAVTHTKARVTDEHNKLLFSAYVGSVFPTRMSATELNIMVPVAGANHQARIISALVSPKEIALMPMIATPQNFAKLMKTLIGRPYGWGGLNFDNDCSAELKSLFTPFGIWLPRHSSNQVTVTKMVDKSSLDQDKRLAYLMENGQPFITLVYIGGHVVLYVGNYANPYQNSLPMAMTYQNMWGLKPEPSIRRAVIGKAVLFPMLLQYPEDTSLVSLASGKYFQVSYLDEFPEESGLMEQKMLNVLDVRELMCEGGC